MLWEAYQDYLRKKWAMGDYNLNDKIESAVPRHQYSEECRWSFEGSKGATYWTTGDGEHVMIEDMDDGHLMNSIFLVLRRNVRLRKQGFLSQDVYPGTIRLRLDFMIREAQRRELPLSTDDWLDRYNRAAHNDTIQEFWKMAKAAAAIKDVWLIAVLFFDEEITKLVLEPCYVLAKDEEDARLQALAPVLSLDEYKKQTDKLVVKVKRIF